MCQMVLRSDSTSSYVVVVESELDALLIGQEAGDLVTVISLGSAQARPETAVHETLETADIILVALDNDDPGIQEAQGWWTENYENAKRWKCIKGKDPTEMHVSGGQNVRVWIQAGLYNSSEKKTIWISD